MKTVILSHTIEHNAANAQVGPDGQAVTSLWKAKKAFVLDRPERQILNQMVLSKIISVTTNQPECHILSQPTLCISEVRTFILIIPRVNNKTHFFGIL